MSEATAIYLYDKALNCTNSRKTLSFHFVRMNKSSQERRTIT